MNIKKTAFSLIELLVVVAVISILASLLLPAISSSRHIARKTTCASNMRQIYQGCLMYVSDWNGWLPKTCYNAEYAYAIMDYLKLDSSQAIVYPGVTIRFRQPSGVCFCPSLSAPPQSSPCWNSSAAAGSVFSPSYMQTVSYSSAQDSGCWVNYSYDSGASLVLLRRLDRIKDGTCLMTDKNWSTTSSIAYQCSYTLANDSSKSNSLSLCSEGANAPGWNHLGAASFLFKDGHVKAYKHAGGQALFDTTNFIPLK